MVGLDISPSLTRLAIRRAQLNGVGDRHQRDVSRRSCTAAPLSVTGAFRDRSGGWIDPRRTFSNFLWARETTHAPESQRTPS